MKKEDNKGCKDYIKTCNDNVRENLITDIELMKYKVKHGKPFDKYGQAEFLIVDKYMWESIKYLFSDDLSKFGHSERLTKFLDLKVCVLLDTEDSVLEVR